MKRLDPSTVRKILTYLPETGKFYWRERADVSAQWNGRYAGKEAGSLMVTGYVTISVGHMHFYAHRLAWLYMTGALPDAQIDHANMDRNDNRWSNLRLANNAENNSNRRALSNNTSGFKGVTWHRQRQKWKAAIGFKNKSIHIGLFDNPEDAHLAYRKAANKLHKEFTRSE